VDGFTLQKILEFIPVNTGLSEVYTADGLTLLLDCASNGWIGIDYQSAYTNADLQASGQNNGALFQYSVPDTTGTGNVALFTPGNDQGNMVIDYANTVGQTVSVTLGFSYGGPLNTGNYCGVWGVGTSAGG
jgi:hypothetical protein